LEFGVHSACKGGTGN
jgi:hypothetical protein